MRKFIGSTWHVGYYSKFTSITLNGNYKIYIVPNNSNIDDVKNIQMIVNNQNVENVEIKYDGSAYPYADDKNFKLLINGECVHSSKYTKKYLIEFDGDFTLKEESFVDH